MTSELILLEDVKNLGKLGDQVRVSDGFARNFLLPKGTAAPVTQDTLQKLDKMKREREKQYAEEMAAAQSLRDRLAEESITIPMEANEQDKLYGSVGPVQIAEALKAKGFEIDADTVVINSPIRELGVYEVELQLHSEVTASVKLWVVRR